MMSKEIEKRREEGDLQEYELSQKMWKATPEERSALNQQFDTSHRDTIAAI
jgi:hypothetical protein